MPSKSRPYGILLEAYHEQHHDWILSIPAKRKVTCECDRCEASRALEKQKEQELKMNGGKKKKIDWAQELVYKVNQYK